jgi:hypothetical protein
VLSYHLADEAVLESKWPPVGANTGAQLSYRGLRLEESDFTLAEESDLHDIVLNYATRCDRISVFGMSYETGDGIDNAHMNTEPNQDGGLVFYFDSANGGPVARWVFLKHQEPTLP